MELEQPTTLHDALTWTRTAKAHSKTDAARELRVSRLTYARWEGEIRSPPVEYRARLAAYLGLTIPEINRLVEGGTE